MGGSILVGLGGAGICPEWAEEQCDAAADEAAPVDPFELEYGNGDLDLDGNPILSTGSGVTYWPARETFLLLDNDAPALYEIDGDTKAFIRRIDLTGFGDAEEIHWLEGNSFAIACEYNTGSMDEIVVIDLPSGGVDTSVDIADATRRIQIDNLTTTSNKGIEAMAPVGGYFYFTTEQIAVTPAEWNMWRVPNSGTGTLAASAEELFSLTGILAAAVGNIGGMASDDSGNLWILSSDENTLTCVTTAGVKILEMDIPVFADATAFTQAEGIEFYRNPDGELRIVITGEDATGVDFMILAPTGTPGPRGQKGLTGGNGADGLNAWTTTAATFIVPPVGGTGTVIVATSEAFAVGQPVFIEGAGYFGIASIPDNATLRVENFGAVGNVPPNAAVVASKKVIGAGRPGPDGVTPADHGTAVLVLRKADTVGGGSVQANTGFGTDGYMSWQTGPLTELYDPDDIVEPINILVQDDENVGVVPAIPLGFYLEPGSYEIHVRAPGFGLDKFYFILKGGIFTAGVPNVLAATDFRLRSSAAFSDTTGTMQAHSFLSAYISTLVRMPVWIMYASEDNSVVELGSALGRPTSFGVGETYLAIKVRRIDRP